MCQLQVRAFATRPTEHQEADVEVRMSNAQMADGAERDPERYVVANAARLQTSGQHGNCGIRIAASSLNERGVRPQDSEIATQALEHRRYTRRLRARPHFGSQLDQLSVQRRPFSIGDGRFSKSIHEEEPFLREAGRSFQQWPAPLEDASAADSVTRR